MCCEFINRGWSSLQDDPWAALGRGDQRHFGHLSHECFAVSVFVLTGRLNSMNGQPATPFWAKHSLQMISRLCIAHLPRSVEKALCDLDFLVYCIVTSYTLELLLWTGSVCT